MRTLILLSLLLASCTPEIVEIPPQPCGGACGIADDCAPTGDDCLTAACIGERCAMIAESDKACATGDAGAGVCNVGLCE